MSELWFSLGVNFRFLQRNVLTALFYTNLSTAAELNLSATSKSKISAETLL